MSTNFPTTIDSYTTKANGDVIDSTHVDNLQDAVVALQTKVGADSSAVTSSIDYKIAHIATSVVDSSWNGIKMFKGYAADTGTANTYAISAPGGNPGGYTAGDTYLVKIANGNTTTSTLNVNSNGTKTLKKAVSSNLVSGDLVTGQVIEVVYDGTNFQIISPLSSTVFGSGVTTKDLSTNTSTVIAHGLGVVPKKVKVTAIFTSTSVSATAVTTYFGSTQSGIYSSVALGSGTGNISGNDGFLVYADTVNNQNTGVISTDATNITIAWTKQNTPTGTAQLLWEAQT